MYPDLPLDFAFEAELAAEALTLLLAVVKSNGSLVFFAILLFSYARHR
jgi:hypothetical protein